MAVEETPLTALFSCIIVLILILIYGRFIDAIINFDGKSNNTEKVEQQKSTLATHDESFISGMVWSDVGRGQ